MMQVTGNNITSDIAKESILSIQLSLGGLSFCIIAPETGASAASVASGTSAAIPVPAPTGTVAPSRASVAVNAHVAPTRKILHTGYFPLVGNVVDDTWLEAVQGIFDRDPWLGLGYQRVSVVWYTDRVCLVPASLYSSQEGKALLLASAGAWSTGRGVGVLPSQVVPLGDDVYVASHPQTNVIAAMYFPGRLYAYLQNRYGTESLSFAHPLLVSLIRPLNSPCVELHTDAQTLYLTVRNPTLLYAEALPYKTTADLLFALQQVDMLFGLKRHHILVTGLGSPEKQQFLRTYYKQSRTDSKPSLTLTYPLYENY